MANVSNTQALQKEYRQLFALAKIRPERAFHIDAVVDRIFAPDHFAKYRAVEHTTGVPAYVVGIIHNLESSQNFGTHLHNGDPLTARTVQVPRGRPVTPEPPYCWDVSAVDALLGHKLDAWKDWSAEGIAYVLERYNGFGYRLHHPHVKSPYLWSFTSIYSAGRYVADGVWSDTAVSGQCGGMAVLKRMIERGRVKLAAGKSTDGGEKPQASKAQASTPLYAGVLRHGSTGAAVVALQKRLLALGITEVGEADGEFGDKTEHAVRLFQARSSDEAGAPLEIDGIVGPRTWAALFGSAAVTSPAAPRPADGSLLDKVLRVAASQIGVMEQPLGSNRGPMVDRYLASVSPSLIGQPWCMAFVHWCFVQATKGGANPAPKSAHVFQSWNMAQGRKDITIVTAQQAQRDPSKVRPGMVFYLSTGGGGGHTGFVADVVGGRITTIEGNTNNGGSREGIGVYSHAGRRIDSINVGFIAFA